MRGDGALNGRQAASVHAGDQNYRDSSAINGGSRWYTAIDRLTENYLGASQFMLVRSLYGYSTILSSSSVYPKSGEVGSGLFAAVSDYC